MSDDRDERNRGEIATAREKTREEKGRFQMKQGDMKIMALVEAYLGKKSFKIWRKDECFNTDTKIFRGRKT